jgi:hypothetical protein
LLFGGPLEAGSATTQAQQAAVQSALSALSGQLESSLVSNLGLPFNYLEITPPEQGLSGTQVQLGLQRDILGAPAFITFGPRLVCQQNILKSETWALSLEFRLSKEWRVAGSVEPVRGCNAPVTAGVPTARQAGVDMLWERNY